MKIQITILTIILILLSGCEFIEGKGTAVADKALLSAEWAICNAATVGSIRRRYGSDQERTAAWNAFCKNKGSVIREIK